jgi:transcriptional regulator GlxA family with amidase domain
MYRHVHACGQRLPRWPARHHHLVVGAILSSVAPAGLARRLERVLGKTPLSYFQDLRVEHAVHRLRTATASVDEIAAEVGYADGVTLRALLRRKLGRGVRELRQHKD